jgi:hypothetical protein
MCQLKPCDGRISVLAGLNIRSRADVQGWHGLA